MTADGRPSFLGRRLGPAFALDVVTIPPGDCRPFDAGEWCGALVVVEQGALEVECRRGSRERFDPGAIVCFDGLPLRSLHNCGDDPVVLVAVTRRTRPAGP